jgi:UDP-N-acetylglucosamine 2-epimerase (non-hydrolysing)
VKVLSVVGNRPQFIKSGPVSAALREAGIEEIGLHTGQHWDPELSDVFYAELGLPEPRYRLDLHTADAATMRPAIAAVLAQERPDWTLVFGDTNSTRAGTEAAGDAGVPVAHVEAGLRSYDRSMPEEHNRVIADHLAELLLTPSRDADENLAAEGIPAERIRFVGNVMIDSLRRYEDRARELDVGRRELGVEDHLLVTLHRPSLVDDAERLLEVMAALERIAEHRPVIFPVHPRTAAMLDEQGWEQRRVRLLEPQGYIRFLSLLVGASAVLTDSGGIQEETTVLGVPCFTLRDTTERPITVSEGTNCVLGTGSEGLARFEELLPSAAPAPGGILEGWDGQAGQRAADALLDRFGDVQLAAGPRFERTA